MWRRASGPGGDEGPGRVKGKRDALDGEGEEGEEGADGVGAFPLLPGGREVGGRGIGVPGHEHFVDGDVDHSGHDADSGEEECGDGEANGHRAVRSPGKQGGEGAGEEADTEKDGHKGDVIKVESLLELDKALCGEGGADVGGAGPVAEENSGGDSSSEDGYDAEGRGKHGASC